jgi:cellulose biosynthesis protein BcsQ
MCRVDVWLFSRWRKFDQGLVKYAKDSLGTSDGGSLTFDTTIARSVAIQECQMAGQTMFQMKPKHRVTSQYRSLAGEIEARIARMS